ncbi:hypothetical protein [Pseudomonas sp. NMI795_08]|uniref:hypothetical protein n=1 Tax=Pseudomonas sp. NMI795_08 TaxID=2903144 RepID=UPI001E451517|nr:hypothetical protein [Pseudomonas sp. NMI795_08]MCE1119085.1 hypothetical protein [Pseudomonas sp. NMI795_08]
MAKRLTPKQMEARYEALAEASEHLRMDWTESATEREQGNAMADWLMTQARAWLLKAEVAKVKAAARRVMA